MGREKTYMPSPEEILYFYFSIVIVVGGLSVLIGIKYTLQTWRRLPRSGWIGVSFGLGLLALVVASLVETPFLILQR